MVFLMEQITEGAQKSADMINNLATALEQKVKAIKEKAAARKKQIEAKAVKE